VGVKVLGAVGPSPGQKPDRKEGHQMSNGALAYARASDTTYPE